MSYFNEKVITYLKKYELKENYYEIPIKEFLQENGQGPIQLAVSAMVSKANLENLELFPLILYNIPKIVIYERGFFVKNKAITFSMPYSKREQYLDFILELDKMVEEDGMIAVFVSNIPYALKCYVVVECLDFFDEVCRMVKEQGLEIIEEQGLDEILKDASKSRMWNGIPLIKGDSIDKKELIRTLFHYETEEELHKKGYQWERKTKKKKVFISYAWVDSTIVREFVSELIDLGASVFIDYQSIDHGENILQRISEGLDESDCFICFFSESFKQSAMAKTELLNIWNDIITRKKKFFPILLDDVIVNDISYGIGNYKYYKFDGNLNELLQTVVKWINK